MFSQSLTVYIAFTIVVFQADPSQMGSLRYLYSSLSQCSAKFQPSKFLGKKKTWLSSSQQCSTSVTNLSVRCFYVAAIQHHGQGNQEETVNVAYGSRGLSVHNGKEGLTTSSRHGNHTLKRMHKAERIN